MNRRQKKKKRKELYKDLIEDVALEISLNSEWRKRIFSLTSDRLEITYQKPDEIPSYVRQMILDNKMVFWVMQVNSSKEHFDKGLKIFMFQSKEYPKIVRYSGNNPNVT